MSEQAVLRLPTIRLREGNDDELIDWMNGLGDEYGYKTQAIKAALRRGIGAEEQEHGTQNGSEVAGAAVTTTTSPADQKQTAAGEAWVADLLQHRHSEMSTANVEALAASKDFRDVIIALDAIERFFESRKSWNEIILSTLWLACQQLLHRIHERRQQLAPRDRQRMQELAEQDLSFMSPPDLAKELTDRAEILYDRKLSFEERHRLIATIRALFEEETDTQPKSFTH